TGGVAHDFNNLLQVIRGNLQLLSGEVVGDAGRRRLGTAIGAVERGAKLTQQLLAFARRQPLEPKAINVSRTIRGMDDLLRRTLGEGIELETVIAGGLWNTFADPAQVESAILNLAVNARDAMDGHGKLTIEASNAMLDDLYASQHGDVQPGQYVMVAITDTGCGMPPEVLARAFEPFFTTKPEGKGTGLGLSMVYGFVKQSNGHVKIYSEVGHGTTVKLYLPRALEPEQAALEVQAGPVVGGSETVLVVEDDAEVRETVVELLEDLGYRVLKASDAQGALAILQSGIAVDLLFTDVVMPGPVRSPELARQAKGMQPGMAVLFTSGYTENAIVHGGRLDHGVDLLSKPYSREQLARKVRQMLANAQQRQAAQQAQRLARKPPAAAGGAALPVHSILLVEDDGDIRAATTDILEELGQHVTAVPSAEEALQVLAAARFDAVITDVALPGMSGLQLAREVMRKWPGTQVVVSSGYGSSSGEVLEDVDCQALPKPYGVAELEALLRRLPAGKREG
ncbi:MAG TPA: response regulator, partial [Candidatus Thermoplasmatota archaeon]|nr:response regulator [Candidatus Thermoplasmatota archaeon]